jgi:hypothetical protein
MGTPQFPTPADLQHMIALLNSKDWNLSMVEKEGCINVLDGDQLQFVAETKQELQAFLYGAFLATYEGKPIKQIVDEVNE